MRLKNAIARTFFSRLVPFKPNPDHHRTNDSSAIEPTAGRSVRKRARARSRSAQIVENPPRSRSGRLKRPLALSAALSALRRFFARAK